MTTSTKKRVCAVCGGRDGLSVVFKYKSPTTGKLYDVCLTCRKAGKRPVEK